MIQIGVIGSGSRISEKIDKIAYEIGSEIASRGAILICGGKGGVMEAACRGCQANNGISVGILPSIKRKEANPYVTIKIPTNLGEDRNYIVVQSSEVLICVEGAIGTRIEAKYTLKINKILITIPKSGGVSKEFGLKYQNDDNYKVFTAKTGKHAVSLAFEKISEY
ncbi:MAG: TIGR00725 family protein [Candidatus Lokiarchaeota archaeon]|nr:TIGR00725 family protein [Candidatus Lokiarchaeota archaeon]